MKILVSGFKPFLGEAINPSELLLAEIQKSHPEISCIVLPVEFSTAFEFLKIKVLETNPDFVIMLGQAAGRKNICLEKVALNWRQSAQPDEAGFIPDVGPINPPKDLALMTKFPVDQVHSYLKSMSHPVEISFSAGTYVCNDLYFKMLSEFSNLKSVFIHVPLLPQQKNASDDRPVMELEMMLEVLTTTIKKMAL